MEADVDGATRKGPPALIAAPVPLAPKEKNGVAALAPPELFEGTVAEEGGMLVAAGLPGSVVVTVTPPPEKESLLSEDSTGSFFKPDVISLAPAESSLVEGFALFGVTPEPTMPDEGGADLAPTAGFPPAPFFFGADSGNPVSGSNPATDPPVESSPPASP